MSAMWETMQRQPEDLARLLHDGAVATEAAERLVGRRIFLVGTGTSWHAANIGAFWLFLAGVDARAVQASDAALYGPCPMPSDALVLISHRGTKSYTSQVLQRARDEGVPTVAIGAIDAPGVDLPTVQAESSSAFTGSYLGALLRLAQLAAALGASLGPLGDVPGTVQSVLRGPSPAVTPPRRLLEFMGAGPNQWTAAEGALKVRETAYVATEGLSYEQLLHGPSVALREGDSLLSLDGGGLASERVAAIADAAEANGIAVYRFVERSLGEPLSVFPLTTHVQRIALDMATALGTDPDSFGMDLPGRNETWGTITL